MELRCENSFSFTSPNLIYQRGEFSGCILDSASLVLRVHTGIFFSFATDKNGLLTYGRMCIGSVNRDRQTGSSKASGSF